MFVRLKRFSTGFELKKPLVFKKNKIIHEYDVANMKTMISRSLLSNPNLLRSAAFINKYHFNIN